MLELSPEAYDGDAGAALVGELTEDLRERYADSEDDAEDDAYARELGPDDVVPPSGLFLVARLDGAVAGCGALRRGSDGQAEVKRMYVVPAARGNGVARALLGALEAEAVRLGYGAIRLETGTRQPEAMALYESAGYAPIPGYGTYGHSPLTRSYAKRLPRPGSGRS